MTVELRDESIAWVMQDEGDELQHRANPSRWGISLTDLSVHRAVGVVVHDLQDLSEREAREILERKWQSLTLNSLPPGIDYLVFDSAVVCTGGVSVNWLYLSYDFLLSGRARGDSGERREFLSRLRRCGDISAWLLYLSPPELNEIVREFMVLRRRRHRSEKDWSENFQVRTNRCNRVSRRALDKLQLWEVAMASPK